jgi:hypothetical protein
MHDVTLFILNCAEKIGLVGVGYDKMNYLHRASARTLMIITWVHVGAHVGLFVPYLISLQC